MLKSKLQFSTFILIALSAVLCTACIVGVIFTGVRGIRPGIFDTEKGKHTSATTLGETADYGQHYLNSMVFIGDSVIYKMRDSGLLFGGNDTRQVLSGERGDLTLDYNVANSTVISTPDDTPRSLSDTIKTSKPDYIVISVGIKNGVSYCGEESFKQYYSSLIEKVSEASPSSRIILQSVLPVSREYEKNTSGISAEKIDQANAWICALAEKYGVRYLDTHAALSDGKGYLKSEYDSGDGLHLSNAGYEALLNYIRTHGYK